MINCRQVRAAAIFAASVVLVACYEHDSDVEEVEVYRCCNSDSPPCSCFISNGQWDPAAGVIQEVALATLGTNTSCVPHGGKPYYQMRNGLNSFEEAKIFACVMEDLTPYISPEYWKREAWCSEAISYWHREAEIPYPTGYRSNEWLFDWQLATASQLRLFYETEEASGGRGRWIHWSDLDYKNLQLGVNAPLPGSYVLIRGYDDSPGRESWTGDDHSMMIDEMTVYRTESGEVDRLTVTILEGDQGDQVKNYRIVNDLLDATPRGGEYISETKKIVGFGVDLGGEGSPISDSSRLHTVIVSPDGMKGIESGPLNLHDETWNSWWGPMVDELVPFIERLRSTGGPAVSVTGNGPDLRGVPDRKQCRWEFSEDGEDFPRDEFEVRIDLLGEHPLLIKQVLLLWSGDNLPLGYRLLFAPSNEVYWEAEVPRIDNSLMMFTSDGVAGMPVPIELSPNGARVRYIKFIFPAGSLDGVRALEEMRFEFKWEP